MDSPDPLYVVSGASRRVGRAVVALLLERGARVRVVNRHGDLPSAWRAAGVSAAAVAPGDARTLVQAFEGASAVAILNSPAYNDPDPAARMRMAAEAVARALRAARVPAAVLQSSIGAHLETGNGVAQLAHIVERAFERAVPVLTIVRSAWWMEDWRYAAPLARDKGLLPSLLQRLDAPLPFVSLLDTARVIADELCSAQQTTTIELAGPHEMSPNDVAHAFSAALDQPVRAQPIAREQLPQILAAWGNSPRMVELWLELFEAMDANRLVFEQTTNTRIRPVQGHRTMADVIAGFDDLTY
jgi:uncharacterized protein YbjT (DUF2867 family)